MSTNTIILLILGLIILVVLVWGFMTGWSSFRGLVLQSNVNEVVQACETDCSISNVYDFCSSQRTLRAIDDDLEVKSSCAVFSGVSDFNKYRVSECSAMDCELSCADIVIDGKSGSKITGTQVQPDAYDVTSIANDVDPSIQRCIVLK